MCVRAVHTCIFMSVCTQANVCTVHVGNAPKEEGLSRATVFIDGHMYLTGPRGECMYKNVCLYQDCIPAQYPNAPPLVCLEARTNSPQSGVGTQRWQSPSPSLSLKPPAACHCSGEEWQTPGSLQVLTGGPGLRLRGAQSAGNLGHPVRS